MNKFRQKNYTEFLLYLKEPAVYCRRIHPVKIHCHRSCTHDGIFTCFVCTINFPRNIQVHVNWFPYLWIWFSTHVSLLNYIIRYIFNRTVLVILKKKTEIFGSEIGRLAPKSVNNIFGFEIFKKLFNFLLNWIQATKFIRKCNQNIPASFVSKVFFLFSIHIKNILWFKLT